MPEINEIVSKQAIKNIVETDSAITKLDGSTIEFVKSVEKLSESLKKGGIKFKDITKAQRATKKQTKELTQLEKDQKTANQALETQRKSYIRIMSKYDAAIRKERKSEQDLINITNGLIAKRKQMTVVTKQDQKEYARLTREIKKNNDALKNQDKQIGKSQRNVGNYGSALKGLGSQSMGALGITAGIYGLINAFKSISNTIKEFSKASSDLAAVLGKTKSEIQALNKDAIRLGSATKFTAAEVTKLQKEFAKLGFTEQQILGLTEATLDLAAATDTDLNNAAEIAGSTIRAFGLNASDSQRVIDSMAKSFSSSALDIDKYKTAMAIVAPVAKNAGISIERTTAILGKIADAGVDASTAGTSLRNVYLELSKQGITWEEAMRKINSATDRNAVALDLFGKRGATVATIIADNTIQIDELTESLENSEGAAREMAKTMQDNLQGDITILKSAWDGLILSFENGEGVISNFFRTSLQWLTQFVNMMNNANKSVAELKIQVADNILRDAIKLDAKEVTNLAEKIGDYDRAVDLIVKQLEKSKEAESANVTQINNRIDALNSLKSVAKATYEDIEQAQKSEAELAEKSRRSTFEGIQSLESITTNEITLQTDLRKAIIDAYYDHIDQKSQETSEKEIQRQRDLTQLKNEVFDEAVSAGFSIYQSNLERESMALIEQRDFQLELAGDNAEKRKEIEEKFAKEQAKIKEKQAKAEKAEALFSIAINTARAIGASIATYPLPAGLPFVVLNAALGAIQAATVLAKPIPKFYKGTESAPKGLISVGERGRELIETKTGELLMANKPTITSGLEGAKIYTNKETETIMNRAGYDSPDLMQSVINSNNRVARAIERQPVLQFETSKRRIIERKGNYSRQYLNRKLYGV